MKSKILSAIIIAMVVNPVFAGTEDWCDQRTHDINKAFNKVGAELISAENALNSINEQFKNTDRLLCASPNDGDLRTKMHRIIYDEKEALRNYNGILAAFNHNYVSNRAELFREECHYRYLKIISDHYNTRIRPVRFESERICFN